MNNVIHLEPKSNMSAQITLTNEYLVIKGKNYILKDWHIKSNSNDLVIPRKDILAIDFIKMRSKRTLMLFIILMSVFVTFFRQIARHKELLILWVLVGAFSLLWHCLRVYRFCRITSNGIMAAVEIKYYQYEQLNYLANFGDKNFI